MFILCVSRVTNFLRFCVREKKNYWASHRRRWNAECNLSNWILCEILWFFSFNFLSRWNQIWCKYSLSVVYKQVIKVILWYNVWIINYRNSRDEWHKFATTGSIKCLYLYSANLSFSFSLVKYRKNRQTEAIESSLSVFVLLV